MAALTADTPITQNVSSQSDLPVASAAVIYDGSIVGLNSSGYARAFTLGDQFAGHAVEGRDNTDGSNGTRRIACLRGRYVLKVTLSGVAITDELARAPVYAQNSGTLDLTEGQRVGRVLQYLSSNTALVEFDTNAETQILSETVAFGDFTDNGNTTGYIDFSSSIPEGSIVHAVQIKVTTGFTGDTTAVADVGIAGTLEKFASDLNVLAADVVGEKSAVETGYCAAAATPRVTVTGGADFGSISAGTMTVRLIYSTSARV